MVERTLSQFEAQVLPDSHPAVAQLNELFGDHTFFLDDDGLYIVEPVEPTETGQAVAVINLANWTDANRTSLSVHEPEPTDVVIEFGSDGATTRH
jgi:hypothetical protein